VGPLSTRQRTVTVPVFRARVRMGVLRSQAWRRSGQRSASPHSRRGSSTDGRRKASGTFLSDRDRKACIHAVFAAMERTGIEPVTSGLQRRLRVDLGATSRN